jgi:hypothetical protein
MVGGGVMVATSNPISPLRPQHDETHFFPLAVFNNRYNTNKIATPVVDNPASMSTVSSSVILFSPKKIMGYVIQSVMLRRDKFTREGAIRWMLEHGYTARKVDTSPTYYHFRQVEHERLRAGHFRNVGLGDIGRLVIFYF